MRIVTTWIRGLVGSLVLAGMACAQGIYPPPETFPDLRLEVAGTVNAIARYDDGSNTWYLIGGDFDLVNGISRRNLARLNANGALDLAWRADTDGTVNALALAGDRLFVGGEFATVDGEPRGRLARVDADDGVVDPDWSPIANNLVRALQTDGDSVWAAGLFTAIDGTARRMIARIDADDASLPAFNAGFNGSEAFALLLDGGELYIGGAGKVKQTGNQRGLMKVNAANGASINWNPSIGPQGGSRIRALAADGTTVYAVGRIRRASNTTRGNGARFLKSNAALQAWNPGADAEIRALAVDTATSAVFVAGDFLNLAGHRRLARTDATSGVASGTWSADADRGVNALLVNGAQVLAGGSFTQLGVFGAQGGLARLSTVTGGIDNAFLGDAAGRGTVASFAFDADGGVILGGSFDAARQASETTLYPRQNVVRLLPGSFELDRTWAVNVVGEVNAVAIEGDNLFLGGNFTSVQASARTRLAKLSAASGALDATWLATADAPVRSLVADGAGARLYAASDFTVLGASLRAGECSAQPSEVNRDGDARERRDRIDVCEAVQPDADHVRRPERSFRRECEPDGRGVASGVTPLALDVGEAGRRGRPVRACAPELAAIQQCHVERLILSPVEVLGHEARSGLDEMTAPDRGRGDETAEVGGTHTQSCLPPDGATAIRLAEGNPRKESNDERRTGECTPPPTAHR